MLDIIRKNGGATFEFDSDTGKRRLVHYKRGYQVSERDMLILDVHLMSDVMLEDIINGLQVSDTREVGVWLDNGLLHIDQSFKWHHLETAVVAGKIHDQQSIYDWENDAVIWLYNYDEDGKLINKDKDFNAI